MTALRTASLAIFFALALSGPVAAEDDAARKKAPGFRAVDVAGDRVSLDDFLGKGPVVICFWATCCKPGVKALPFLQRILDQYGAKGVQVVAVAVDPPRRQSQVKRFVAARKYTFRVLVDSDREVFRKLQGTGTLPYIVVLDSQGFMRWQHTGYVPGNEKELEHVIVKLLGRSGEAPPTDAAPDSSR